MPTVLLDRDGTIIADKHYLSDPGGVELLPNAVQGLERMRDNGWQLAVVSNQSGVGRGYFTEKDVHRVNARLTELLHPLGVTLHYYHCPHDPAENCDCRKPAPGMLLFAAADLGFTPAECVVIGDKPCDVDLGRGVNATSILVRTGKGAASEGKCEPDFVADDLLQAALWIEERFKECP